MLGAGNPRFIAHRVYTSGGDFLSTLRLLFSLLVVLLVIDWELIGSAYHSFVGLEIRAGLGLLVEGILHHFWIDLIVFGSLMLVFTISLGQFAYLDRGYEIVCHLLGAWVIPRALVSLLGQPEVIGIVAGGLCLAIVLFYGRKGIVRHDGVGYSGFGPVLIGLAILAMVAYPIVNIVKSGDSLKPAEEGKPSPTLEVIDTTGKTVVLPYAGQPQALTFWATWCGPCKRQLAQLKGYENDKGPIRYINLDDMASAKALFQSRGYRMDHLVFGGRDALRKFGARTIPTTVFIDSKGHVQEMMQSGVSPRQLDRLFNKHQ